MDFRRERAVRGYGQWDDAVPAEEPKAHVEVDEAAREKIAARIRRLRFTETAAGYSDNERQSARRLADRFASEAGLGPNGELPPEPDLSDRALIEVGKRIARHYGAHVSGTPRFAAEVAILGPASAAWYAQQAYRACIEPFQRALAGHAVSLLGEPDSQRRLESFAAGYADRLFRKAVELDGLGAAPLARPKGMDADWNEGYETAAEVAMRLQKDEPEVRTLFWA